MAIVVAVSLSNALPVFFVTPRINWDSGAYLGLGLERLPVVPVIYLLLGHNYTAIDVFQALAGVCCWGYLAFEALRATRRPWCYVAFAGVLLISSSDYVTHWYGAVLSDSLSLSFLALLLASFASWLKGRASLTRVMVVALLWAFTRNTNGYILFLFGAVALVVALVRHRERGPLLASGVAVVGGLAVSVLSATGQLWVQSFLHVMTERVLADRGRTQWFAARGMPVSKFLKSLGGPYSVKADTALHFSPALAGWRHWMYSAGERTYVEYALTHPWWTITGTFGAHEELMAPLTYYGASVSRPWLPPFVRGLFLSFRQTTLLAGAGVLGAAALWRRRSLGRVRRDLFWWGTVLLAGVVNLIVDWVGDSWEIGRHSIGATVQIAVAVLFALAVVLGSTGTPAEPDPRASEMWAGEDSNPRRRTPAGLQPASFGHSDTDPLPARIANPEEPAVRR